MAVGLGSMDMPVPSVAEWEWLNWKFPRAVHAGDTIYARWTLTQKRAPVGGAPTAIVVWRVDVHSAGGALCAEGEVGASVLRNRASTTAPATALVEEPATAGPPAPRRRRGRRRPAPGDGAKNAGDANAVVVVEAPVAAPAQGAGSPAPPATQARAAGGARRRRRRRSPSSSQARNGDAAAPALPALPAAPVEAAGSPARRAAAAGPEAANPLSRVIRRLRRTGA
jgi:hypothetical protein